MVSIAAESKQSLKFRQFRPSKKYQSVHHCVQLRTVEYCIYPPLRKQTEKMRVIYFFSVNVFKLSICIDFSTKVHQVLPLIRAGQVEVQDKEKESLEEYMRETSVHRM